MSGAPSSRSLLSLLFLLITLLYKSFKSEVANLPPSSCTIGLMSGGITGITSRIIHSGLLPESLSASITSSLLTILIFFCPEASFSFFLKSAESSSRSMSDRSFLIASAPMPASNLYPNCSFASLYCCSLNISLYPRPVSPGSVTIYEAKYRTFSRFLGVTSRQSPILDGIPLKYQMWETGAANFMWPILSLLTFALVTSTPHRSQTIPLYLILLYLPQWHSQSFIGPKIFSQKSPSFSGLRVL